MQLTYEIVEIFIFPWPVTKVAKTLFSVVEGETEIIFHILLIIISLTQYKGHNERPSVLLGLHEFLESP